MNTIKTNEHVMNRADMINMIAQKINAKSYLEIGVQTGKTFRAVNIGHKVGVDPDPQWRDQTHLMSSDYYFSVHKDKFDIIFVDGLHESEQVYRDIQNALQCLNVGGVILVDDCAPKLKEYQTRQPTAIHWTGDVWRSWIKVRKETEFFTETYDIAFGIGIIDTSKKSENDLAEISTSVSYEEFRLSFEEYLCFRNVDVFQERWNSSQKKRIKVVTGPGSCGTSFFIELLARLGLTNTDTLYFNQKVKGGREYTISTQSNVNNIPSIIKDPRLFFGDFQKLIQYVDIDFVWICIRDYEQISSSRIARELPLEKYAHLTGEGPGLFERQIDLCKKGQDYTLAFLELNNIKYEFVDYEQMHSYEYCHEKINIMYQIDLEQVKQAHISLYDKALKHKY